MSDYKRGLHDGWNYAARVLYRMACIMAKKSIVWGRKVTIGPEQVLYMAKKMKKEAKRIADDIQAAEEN